MRTQTWKDRRGRTAGGDSRVRLMAFCERLAPRAQFASHPAMGLLLVLGIISAVVGVLLWAYGRPGWEGFTGLAAIAFTNTIVGTFLTALCEKPVEQETRPRSDEDTAIWIIPTKPRGNRHVRDGHHSLFV